MLSILIGSDFTSKEAFVSKAKQEFEQGLLAISYDSFTGKELSSIVDIGSLFRSNSLSGSRLLVIWDIDSASGKAVGQVKEYIEKLRIFDDRDAHIVIEGVGRPRSHSAVLASAYPSYTKLFGDIPQDISLYAIAKAILSKNINRAIELQKRFGEIDETAYQMLIGAIRKEAQRYPKYENEVIKTLLFFDKRSKTTNLPVSEEFYRLMAELSAILK